MREFPLNRVVGQISNAESDRQHLTELTRKRFKEQQFFDIPYLADLPKWEREKTADEVKICGIAAEMIDRILDNFGVPLSEIPLQNIHVIKHSAWGNVSKMEEFAYHLRPLQSIFIREHPARTPFARSLMHEMTHMKLYGALQLLMQPRQKEISVYRSGLLVISRNGKIVRLFRLNEALTEELVLLGRVELFRHPFFSSEAEITKKIKRNNPNARLSSGELLSDNPDVWFARIIGRKAGIMERPDLLNADKTPMIGTMEVAASPYRDERRIFNKLIESLLKYSGGNFKTKAQVFRIFVDAAATGNILPLRRLIDTNFGRGTFLEIANNDVKEIGDEKAVQNPITELERVIYNLAPVTASKQ